MSKRTVSAKSRAMSVEGHKTRRAALGVLASAPAIPKIGDIAALPDRIFAAIERHSDGWIAVGSMSPTIDDVAAMQEGREINQADWEASEHASSTEEQALDILLNKTPTTAAGVRAAIQYLFGYDHGRPPDNTTQFLLTLLKCPFLTADARR